MEIVPAIGFKPTHPQAWAHWNVVDPVGFKAYQHLCGRLTQGDSPIRTTDDSLIIFDEIVAQVSYFVNIVVTY